MEKPQTELEERLIKYITPLLLDLVTKAKKSVYTIEIPKEIHQGSKREIEFVMTNPRGNVNFTYEGSIDDPIRVCYFMPDRDTTLTKKIAAREDRTHIRKNPIARTDEVIWGELEFRGWLRNQR